MAFDVEDETETATTNSTAVAAPPPPLTEEQKAAVAAERERKFLEVVTLARSVIAQKDATTGLLTVVTYESTRDLVAGLREAAETAASSAEDVREARMLEVKELLGEIEPAWSFFHYRHELIDQAVKAGLSDAANIGIDDLPARIASAASEEMLRQIDTHLNGLALTGDAARKRQADGHAIYARAISEKEAERVRVEGIRKELATCIASATAVSPSAWKKFDAPAAKDLHTRLRTLASNTLELTKDDREQAANTAETLATIHDNLVCLKALEGYGLGKLTRSGDLADHGRFSNDLLADLETKLAAFTVTDFIEARKILPLVGNALTAIRAEQSTRAQATVTPAPAPTTNPAPAAAPAPTQAATPAANASNPLVEAARYLYHGTAGLIGRAHNRFGGQLVVIAVIALAIFAVAWLVGATGSEASGTAVGSLTNSEERSTDTEEAPETEPDPEPTADTEPAPDPSVYPLTLEIPTRGSHACQAAPEHAVCEEDAERELPEGAVWYCPGMRRYRDIACAPMAECNYCIPGCHVCLPR